VEQNEDQQIEEEPYTSVDMVMEDSLRDAVRIQNSGAKMSAIKNLARNMYVYLQNKIPISDSIFISFSF
jgi:hypothetical protein